MAAKGDDIYQRKAHFTFIWDIEHFFELCLNLSALSPRFITEFTERIEWVLTLRINCVKEEIELGLQRTDMNGPDNIEIEFKFSLFCLQELLFEAPTLKKQFKGGDEYWLELKDIDLNKMYDLKMLFSPITVNCRMWKTGTEVSKFDTCFARTRLGMARRSFIWPITKFNSLQVGQKRTHVVKPLKGSPKLTLDLFLSKRDLKIFLNIEVAKHSGTRNHPVLSGISLLDSNGRAFHFMGNFETFDNKFYEFSQDDKFHEFFEIDNFKKESFLVNDDTLFIRCLFISGANAVWSRIEHHTHFIQKTAVRYEMDLWEQDESCTSGCLFKKAFEELYGDESLSDVSLRSGTKSFNVHKNVLSVRSPVFKAMFSHDMKEKSSKIVDIPDFNADTMSRLLLYIYKNTVEELQWVSAMSLYRAADKYQLLDLRKKCSFFLESNLSTINVCSLLSLGIMHEDRVLRKAAEDFISEHDEVFDSVEWKNFRAKNYRLAFEIMEKIIRIVKRRNR